MLNTERCEDYLAEVKAFAEANGLTDKLEKQLNYLDTYADHDNNGRTKCDLFKDFAPQSFAFNMMKRSKDGEYKFWFNGGVIFYAPNDSGVGCPQLSVRIGDTSEADWSINT